jgi:hypothetical protein
MRMTKNNIFQCLLVIFSPFLLSSVYASTYLAAGGNDPSVRVQADAIENVERDVISLQPANQYGVSVNYFSTFDVRDRPLRLVNVPSRVTESVNGQDEDLVVAAASTIVVVAANPDIRNEIKFVDHSLHNSTTKTSSRTTYKMV